MRGVMVRQMNLNARLGLAAIAGAVFFLLIAIPAWVSSPANVPKIVLSPTFWPNVIAILLGIIGAALLLDGLRRKIPDAVAENDVEDRRAAMGRMLGIAVIMIGTMLLTPRLGMVWTTMLVFAATAFLVRTRHPRAALVCAVIIPLVLYAFFAHIAGVAIPQGDLVRLP